MNTKQYKMLGSTLRRIMDNIKTTEMQDEILGKMIAQYVTMLELESESNVRDRQNGRGE
jgi:hypothetical protein